MPNGHGGIPFLGAPVLLAGCFCAAVWLPLETTGWVGLVRVGLGFVFAILFGWRLAYHLHMRAADDYGGAYTTEDESARASGRFRFFTVLYTAGSLVLAGAVMHGRGLL